MRPDESSRALFTRYLGYKDDAMRAAAAEGFARMKNPGDRQLIQQAYEHEGKASPRLSMAFAMVSLGSVEISEFSPLQLLVNTLNSRAIASRCLRPFANRSASFAGNAGEFLAH